MPPRPVAPPSPPASPPWPPRAAEAARRPGRGAAGPLALLRGLFPPGDPALSPEALRAWEPLDPARGGASRPGPFLLLSRFPYEGPAGTLVRRAKYGGSPFPSDAAAELLHEALRGPWAPLLPGRFAPAVVPVPPSPWSYLRRGFHLPSELSRRLARRAGWPCLPALLRRSRGGTAQASLPLPGRKENARGLFRPGSRPPGAPPDVLLVDDVAASGATAAACAAALKAGGARLIVVVTLARSSRHGS